MLSTKMKPQYRNSKKQKVVDGQTCEECAQTSLDAPAKRLSTDKKKHRALMWAYLLKKDRGIENT